MESEKSRESKELVEPAISGEIRQGLEKEAELQRQAEELDRKYRADLEDKKTVAPKTNKLSPWLLASAATFIISGLTAFGPEGLAYIIFGLSSIGLGLESYKWFTRETPEQITRREKERDEKSKKDAELLGKERSEKEKENNERVRRHEAEKEEREKIYRAKAEAASKLPAISMTQLGSLTNVSPGISKRCRVIRAYDDLRVIILSTGHTEYADDVIHLANEEYIYFKSQGDGTQLGWSLKMWGIMKSNPTT